LPAGEFGVQSDVEIIQKQIIGYYSAKNYPLNLAFAEKFT
jgi:hypothetical protein